MLLNALEHGSFGVDKARKNYLLEHDLFEDEGKGFDTKVLKELVINPENVNGRGFMIIKKLLDHFYFNEKGNAITIQKFIS